MKIGFLINDNTKQLNLIAGLKNKGCDTASYVAPVKLKSIDIMKLSEFMHATDCDVIHNELGTLPLIFYPGLKTPVLTILNNNLSDDDLLIVNSSAKTCYFASDDMTLVTKEILDKTFPLTGSDIIGSYYGIYENILKETAPINRRPWGFYEVLSDQNNYKVKKIKVNPGKRLSLQSHARRSEHWIVVTGTGVVTVNGNNVELGEGASIDIPKGAAHRISNPGDSPLVFIEIQTGDYFGEDDIIRLEDDFGRA
jgi:mannose-6-phosphate isomerase-like protein (cupin superfamily)